MRDDAVVVSDIDGVVVNDRARRRESDDDRARAGGGKCGAAVTAGAGEASAFKSVRSGEAESVGDRGGGYSAGVRDGEDVFADGSDSGDAVVVSRSVGNRQHGRERARALNVAGRLSRGQTVVVIDDDRVGESARRGR